MHGRIGRDVHDRLLQGNDTILKKNNEGGGDLLNPFLPVDAAVHTRTADAAEHILLLD